MQEFFRVLVRALYFVLDIIGQVLTFLVKLASQGVAYYNQADLVGKLLGLLLIFFVAWVLVFVVHTILTTAARYAIAVLVCVVIVALLAAILDPNSTIALRR